MDNGISVFVHIIGSIPDVFSDVNQISGYNQPANGILIEKLTENLTCSQFAKSYVLAFGEKSNYDIYRNTNNKCYYQLDSEHCYELDMTHVPRFKYFDSSSTAMNLIREIVEMSSIKNVMFFFDDYRTDCLFSSIDYLNIYQLLMNFSDCNFLIFNNSYNSGSLIDVVQTYNEIYDLKVNKRIEDIQRIVYSISALVNILIKEAKKDKQTVDEAYITVLITNAIESFSRVNVSNENVLNAIINIPVEHCPKLSRSLKIRDVMTVEDVFYFKSIISSLYSFKNVDSDILDTFYQCLKVFTLDNFNVFKGISNNIIKLASIIEIFKQCSTVDFTLEPHPNIEIITSTDSNYSNICANEETKVFPGSIGMGSFIKEAFMKLVEKPINFERIKNDISAQERVEQNMRGDYMKRECICLNPQHFKKGSYQFAFSLSDEMRKMVYCLRIISYNVVKTLRHVAEMIAPDFAFDPETVSNDHDPIGDIVALTALAKIDYFPNSTFLQFENINGNNPINIQAIEKIVRIALQLSKDPIKMSAHIFYYLQQAAIQVVKEEYKGKYNTENMEIAKAIIVVMPFSAIVFSTIIAALCTKERTAEYVCNSVGKAARKKIRHEGSFLLNKAINELPKMNSHDEKIEYAEKCLMAYAKCALNYVENICNSQTINNISDRIYKGMMKYYTALSITIAIANRASEYEAQGTENILFNTIDRAYSSLAIQFQLPQQFKLNALCEMSEGSAIKALAIFFYEEAEKKGKDIPLKEIFERIMHIVKTPSNDTYDNSHLSKLVEIIFEKIDDTKETIKNFRNDLLDEAIWAVEMTMERFRIWKRNCVLDIGNRISPTFYDKTNSSLSGLKSIRKMVKKSMPKSRIHSTLIELEKNLDTIKPIHRDPFEMCDHGFGATRSPLDMGDIRMRAAHELYSVASRIAVYDPSIESIKIEEKDHANYRIITALESMIARACNIVEIAPLIEMLYPKIRDIRFTTMPIKFDEVMAVAVSGVKHFTRQKDMDTMRSQSYSFSSSNSSEFSSPYTSSISSHCALPVTSPYTSPVSSPSISPVLSPYTSPVSYPYTSPVSYPYTSPVSSPYTSQVYSTYMSPVSSTYTSPVYSPALIRKPSPNDLEKQSGKRRKLRGLIDTGCVLTRKSNWKDEAWPVFVYRFNVHVRHLGIKFDPDIKYDGNEVFVARAYYRVLEFYPITEISDRTNRLSNFYRFVGKHKEHFEAISDAFIKAFDDTDRTVTPRHFDCSTMQRGDDDYYVDESEQ